MKHRIQDLKGELLDWAVFHSGVCKPAWDGTKPPPWSSDARLSALLQEAANIRVGHNRCYGFGGGGEPIAMVNNKVERPFARGYNGDIRTTPAEVQIAQLAVMNAVGDYFIELPDSLGATQPTGRKDSAG